MPSALPASSKSCKNGLFSQWRVLNGGFCAYQEENGLLIWGLTSQVLGGLANGSSVQIYSFVECAAIWMSGNAGSAYDLSHLDWGLFC
jgi:hypothetical protein